MVQCKKCPHEVKKTLKVLKTVIENDKRNSSSVEYYRTVWNRLHEHKANEQQLETNEVNDNGPESKSLHGTNAAKNRFNTKDNHLSGEDQSSSAEESKDPLGNENKYYPLANDRKLPSQNVGNSFVRINSGWVCKQCHQVPFQFRAPNSFFRNQPSPHYVQNHLNCCKGNVADVTKLIKSVYGMTRTVSGMDFNLLTDDNFVSFVRAIVGGNEYLVFLFTEQLQLAVSGCSYSFIFPSNVIFPAKIDSDSALKSLSSLGRNGLWFNFVEDIHFMEFVKLISPGFQLPSMDELISVDL